LPSMVVAQSATTASVAASCVAAPVPVPAEVEVPGSIAPVWPAGAEVSVPGAPGAGAALPPGVAAGVSAGVVAGEAVSCPGASLPPQAARQSAPAAASMLSLRFMSLGPPLRISAAMIRRCATAGREGSGRTRLAPWAGSQGRGTGGGEHAELEVHVVGSSIADLGGHDSPVRHSGA